MSQGREGCAADPEESVVKHEHVALSTGAQGVIRLERRRRREDLRGHVAMFPLLAANDLGQAENKGTLAGCPQKKVELGRQGLGGDGWRLEHCAKHKGLSIFRARKNSWRFSKEAPWGETTELCFSKACLCSMKEDVRVGRTFIW